MRVWEVIILTFRCFFPLGPTATVVVKYIASMISDNQDEAYAYTAKLFWETGFTLICSAIM